MTADPLNAEPESPEPTRPTELSWEEANNRYLAASLTWLRARLAALAPPPPAESPAPTTGSPAPPVAGVVVAGESGTARRWNRRAIAPSAPASSAPASGSGTSSAPGVDDVTEAGQRRVAAADTGGMPPALLFLAERLGLTEFERDTLLLCVAPAVDPSIGVAIARAHGDPAATAPTYALALQLLADARWDALSPERGLRFWRLVEAFAAPAQPLTTAGLRADDRIVDLVKGLNHLDERLAGSFAQRPDPAAGVALPPSLAVIADRLVAAVLADTPDGRFGVIQLVGPDPEGAELLAVRALARLDRIVYRTTPALLSGAGLDADTLARLWQRESLLLPVALLIDGSDADLDDPGVAGPLRRFIGQLDGLVVLATREVWPLADGRVTVVDVERPTAAEQRDLWVAQTGAPPEGAPARLAAQFRLSLPTLRRVATAARAGSGSDPADGDSLTAALWSGCLAATRPRMEALAVRTEPRAQWDDLVLPDEQLDLLRQLLGQVRGRQKVMLDWGFERRLARGAGITALFAGPSGTGKTFAAEVLAGRLGLDLYRVDLSAVVNKYIGETEKNLRRVFDAAEDGGALLFFDEADALFGRRSEVRDSHDRYANIEVNYLLQRMEAYHGLAVLATNLRGALDPAFLRRLRFVVEFDVPGPVERRRLWARAFPAVVPVGDLDLDQLARLSANGAAIQQIALGAAFLAADENTAVDTATVLRAARTEFRKLGLPLPVMPAARAGAVSG